MTEGLLLRGAQDLRVCGLGQLPTAPAGTVFAVTFVVTNGAETASVQRQVIVTPRCGSDPDLQWCAASFPQEHTRRR